MTWILSLLAKVGLGGISARTWKIIGIVVAVVGLIWLHQHMVHKALKAADKAGYNRRDQEVKVAALKLKAKVDGLTAKITTQERVLNAQAHRTNDAAADALLVRGPGKAVCSVRPGAPSSAVRDTSGSSVAVDGQVAGVPDPGGQSLIALPYVDTVGFAREFDACQIDRKSWERWYGEVVKVWPKP